MKNLARSFLSLACRTHHHRKPSSLSSSASRRWMETSSSKIFGGEYGQNVAMARGALYNADAVCFDVDSTVIDEEGIDVLAKFLGKHKEVSALTKEAMQGGMKFQDALQQRLELLKPSKKQILDCITENPGIFTPCVDTLVQLLTLRGTDVYLVSGGFRIMIEPIAHGLDLPVENIIANTILFDDAGNYSGFDYKEPTSRDMGKRKALQRLKDEHGYETMVMVGDGATDAQAKPPADAFIGYGGVAVREAVRDSADWFVNDFTHLIEVIYEPDSDE